METRKFTQIWSVVIVALLISIPFRGVAESLWEQQGGSDFADNTALNVGDIVMIEVSESANATTESDRERQKDVSAGGESNVNEPGSNIFNNIVDAIPLFGAGFDGNSDYNSERELDADNSLNTTMSVKVVEKRSNGIIKLKGERKLKLGDEIKTLKFEGIARANDVKPDNTIPSDRIANAEIFYQDKLGLATGKADSIFSKGWLFIKNTMFY